jgi:hypothetical protein
VCGTDKPPQNLLLNMIFHSNLYYFRTILCCIFGNPYARTVLISERFALWDTRHLCNHSMNECRIKNRSFKPGSNIAILIGRIEIHIGTCRLWEQIRQMERYAVTVTRPNLLLILASFVRFNLNCEQKVLADLG